jgi:hypothetical protein
MCLTFIWQQWKHPLLLQRYPYSLSVSLVNVFVAPTLTWGMVLVEAVFEVLGQELQVQEVVLGQAAWISSSTNAKPYL